MPDKQTLRQLPVISYLGLVVAYIYATYSTFEDRFVSLHGHWTTAGDMDMGYALLGASILFSCLSLKGSLKIRPHWLFILPALTISALFYISSVLDLKSVFFLCLPLGFIALLGLTLGTQATIKILIANLIYVMALPFWYIIIPFLQWMTVYVNSIIIELLGMTAYIEGNYITVPSGVIHVAGGCSGLKYFLSSVALALISSAWNKQRLLHAIISVALAASLAILANWIRVAFLIQIGYSEGISHPLMADHDLLGWCIFVVAMIPWLVYESKSNQSAYSNETAQASSECNENNSPALLLFAAVAGILVLVAPSLSIRDAAHNENISLLSFATALALPETREPQTPRWKPNFPESDAELHQQLLYQGKVLDFSAVYFSGAGPGELAKTTNEIFPVPWRLLSDTPVSTKNKDLKLRSAHGVNNAGQYRQVFYWYWQHGEMFNSIISSKLAMLKYSLTRDQSGQLIAISRRCSESCSSVNEIDPTLEQLISSLVQQLRTQK